MKDKKLNSLIWLIVGGVLAWAGTQLLNIQPHITKNEEQVKSLQEKAEENRESIQGLIDLHLQK